jgi:hypothetical protein
MKMFGMTIGEGAPSQDVTRKEEIKKLLSDLQIAEDVLLQQGDPDKTRLRLSQEAKERLSEELSLLEGGVSSKAPVQESHVENVVTQRKAEIGGESEAYTRKLEEENKTSIH